MAYLLRRPLCRGAQAGFFRSSRSVQRIESIRCFSQSAPWFANALPQYTAPTSRTPRSAKLDATMRSAMPNDIGLLPGTVIRPPFSSHPRIHRHPLRFLNFQYQILKSKAISLGTLLIVAFSSPKTGKWPWNSSWRVRPQSNTDIIGSAEKLHRMMYEAFASGDSQALRSMCTDGLYVSFQTRLAQRPKGEKVIWKSEKGTRKSRIMSHRAAALPNTAGVVVRQVVVRISSRQALSKIGPKGEIKGNKKDIVEYVVLQRMSKNWEEGRWQIWGMAEPTLPRDLLTKS